MAIFSPMERVSPQLTQSHMAGGDRGSNRLKLGRIFALIVSGLLFLSSSFFCKSQTTNQLAYESLVRQLVADHHRPFDSLVGVTTPALDTLLLRDATANCNLQVGPPRINWRKLGHGRYLREMEVTILYTDSNGGEFLAAATDTVPRRDIRQLRKSKVPELRGENPRFVSKYLGPAALIGILIAGIISLFYLRS